MWKVPEYCLLLQHETEEKRDSYDSKQTTEKVEDIAEESVKISGSEDKIYLLQQNHSI